MDEQDSTGKTAILIALADGRDKCTEFIIRNGCDVNVVDKLGQSALFLALSSHHTASPCNIRRLLKSG